MRHGIFTKDHIVETLKKMAKIVDDQNKNDKNYIPMSKDFENSLAVKASFDVIIEGTVSTTGYTVPMLHKRRVEVKSMID